MNGETDPDLDIASSYTNFGKSLVSVAAPGGDFDFFDLPGWDFDMVLSTSRESLLFRQQVPAWLRRMYRVLLP